MAKNPSFPAPFGEPIQIDTDDPISVSAVTELCRSRRKGFSIRLRSGTGNSDRGGYLFHVRMMGSGFTILDYRGRVLHVFNSLVDLRRFINHTAGREFDSEMFEVAEEINLKMGEPGTNDRAAE
jgi:hypothetical protein